MVAEGPVGRKGGVVVPDFEEKIEGGLRSRQREIVGAVDEVAADEDKFWAGIEFLDGRKASNDSLDRAQGAGLKQMQVGEKSESKRRRVPGRHSLCEGGIEAGEGQRARADQLAQKSTAGAWRMILRRKHGA